VRLLLGVIVLVIAGECALALFLVERRPSTLVPTFVGTPIPWNNPSSEFEMRPGKVVRLSDGTLEIGEVATSCTSATLALRRSGKTLSLSPLNLSSEVALGIDGDHLVIATTLLRGREPDPSTIDLIESRDDGRSFVHLARVVRPSEGVPLRSVLLVGARLELAFDASGGELADVYWSAWQRTLARHLPYTPRAPSLAVLVSTDGGRSFSLRSTRR
jgi:hypothetical protein